MNKPIIWVILLSLIAAGCAHMPYMPLTIEGTPPHTTGFGDVPQYFQDAKAARAAGCDIVPLKDGDAPNCILKWFSGKKMFVAIYDHTADGGFRRTHLFELPSWYWGARITYDLMPGVGADTYFMGVRFEGNRGTGTMQWLYMLIGSDGHQFQVCLLETVSYCNLTHGGAEEGDEEGDEEELSTIVRLSSGFQSATLESTFTGKYNLYWKGEKKGTWTEYLSWDADSFSFYDAEKQAQLAEQVRFPIRQRIAQSRIAFLNERPPVDDLFNYFDRTPIFFRIMR